MNQEDFIKNDSSCWLSGANTCLFNNVLDREIKQEDLNSLEDFYHDESKYATPQGALTVIWGLKRVCEWAIKKLKLPNITYVMFEYDSDKFKLYLKKGKLISFSIIITEKFVADWKAGKVIKWDYSKSKVLWTHIVAWYQEGDQFYMVNSRDKKTNIRLFDWNAKGLLKTMQNGISPMGTIF